MQCPVKKKNGRKQSRYFQLAILSAVLQYRLFWICLQAFHLRNQQRNIHRSGITNSLLELQLRLYKKCKIVRVMFEMTDGTNLLSGYQNFIMMNKQKKRFVILKNFTTNRISLQCTVIFLDEVKALLPLRQFYYM